MEITVLENGNLQLQISDQEERQEFALNNVNRGEASAICDALEPYSCNGSYTWFCAGDGNPFVGLSNAPCIAERLDVDDNGECTVDGDFWFLDDYMVRDYMAELGNGLAVIFTKADRCEPDVKPPFSVEIHTHGILRDTVGVPGSICGLIGSYVDGVPYEPDKVELAKTLPFRFRKAVARSQWISTNGSDVLRLDLVTLKGKPFGTLFAKINRQTGATP